MTIATKTLSCLALFAGLGLVSGCEKGPAEKAGSSIDKGMDKIEDTVNPPAGPADKAGRAIDRATGNH